MEQTTSKAKNVALRWIAAVIAPFALLSGYCVLKHSLLLPVELDYLVPVLFALICAAFVATVPSQPPARVALVCVYVPLLSIALFAYGFVFYGLVYQRYP